MDERVEALGIAVLGLAVLEAGDASEPPPIGNGRIRTELCRKGAEFFGGWLDVTQSCLGVAGDRLDHGGGGCSLRCPG